MKPKLKPTRTTPEEAWNMKQDCHIYVGVRVSVEEVNYKLDTDRRAEFWNGVAKILTSEQEKPDTKHETP